MILVLVVLVLVVVVVPVPALLDGVVVVLLSLSVAFLRLLPPLCQVELRLPLLLSFCWRTLRKVRLSSRLIKNLNSKQSLLRREVKSIFYK